jgi:hypothetical protein
MNKIIAATMMLMLVACSDNFSVNGPENRQLGGGTAVLDSTRNVSLKMGACNDHPYDNVLLKDASANPKAYLITDENGAYQVVIPNLTDACGVGEVVFNNQRSLDTLIISYTVGVVTDCMCITDHYFNIDPLDADIKFLKHWGIVYDVVPGPVPGNQSISDSSATQSASLINAECKNILAKADESDVNLIPDVLDTATEKQTVAIRSAVDDKFDRVYIDDVDVYCGTIFDEINVTASNDTLYVETKKSSNIDLSEPIPSCLCPTLVSFNIEKTPKFSNANYLVYEGYLTMPIENR